MDKQEKKNVDKIGYSYRRLRNHIEIGIGEKKFKISKSPTSDGLVITKHDLSDSNVDTVCVRPKCSNEIEIV